MSNTREALARLWPLIEKAMSGLVFTGDKAGEVTADIADLEDSLRQIAVAVGADTKTPDVEVVIARVRALALAAPVSAVPASLCACNEGLSLSSYSGGAAPEGWAGRLTMRREGKFVDYVPAGSAVPAEPLPEAVEWETLDGTERTTDKALARNWAANVGVRVVRRAAVSAATVPAVAPLEVDVHAPASPQIAAPDPMCTRG